MPGIFVNSSAGEIHSQVYTRGLANCPSYKDDVSGLYPNPSGQITFAKGYYDSIYERISSEWENEGSKITYKFTVPVNTSATLYLPAKKQITKSEKSVKYDKTEGDKVLIPLTSGSYVFEVK